MPSALHASFHLEYQMAFDTSDQGSNRRALKVHGSSNGVERWDGVDVTGIWGVLRLIYLLPSLIVNVLMTSMFVFHICQCRCCYCVWNSYHLKVGSDVCEEKLDCQGRTL